MSRNRERGQIWTTAEAADNTATVITITPGGDQRVFLGMVLFGYDAKPTALIGRVTVTIGGTETLSLPITESGPGPMTLPEMNGAKGAAVVITIAAAGAAVQGSLTTMHYLEG